MTHVYDGIMLLVVVQRGTVVRLLLMLHMIIILIVRTVKYMGLTRLIRQIGIVALDPVSEIKQQPALPVIRVREIGLLEAMIYRR